MSHAAAEAQRGDRVKDLSPNFGILIAFILPGVVALWGMAYFLPAVRAWFVSTDSNSVFFVLLASLALGVFVSGIRWLIFDQAINRLFGLTEPEIDFWRITKSEQGMKALAYSVETTYRYYQYYSNTAVGLLLAYSCRLFAPTAHFSSCRSEVLGVALLFLVLVCLTFSARSCLLNYYKDLRQLNAA